MSKQNENGQSFMVKLATFIVDKRNLFFLITVILLIFSAFSRNWVEVENDLTFYLPDEAETKQALTIMEEQFTTYGTAEVMVENITYDEAEKLKDNISAIGGVQSVAFDQTSDHYNNASALFSITFDYDETEEECLTALEDVKQLLSDYDLYVSTDLGNAIADTIDREVSIIMVYVAVIVVVVLTITSQTYGEVPVLILTFVTAMVLNQGSNFLLEKISFVSNSVTRKCSSDEYPKGLDVVLTADIDAEGRAVSIPIFFGTFDGQNHRIYGLELKESASEYGFFSHIESGATVKNLVLEGEIVPNGTQSCIGGIAGVNSGRIENCSFSGVVIASGYVGGIAGKNETEGTVTGCTVTGAVRGTQYTGGIVGQNAGTVIRATNSSAVNTAIDDESGFADTEKIESTIYNILKNEKTTENAVTTDTGGIAGYSTGILQSCTNGGSIGYEHVGYNVGGIAGRQNGYMANCINRGSVFGRKDVGGVVGQMAPDITLRFSTDGIDELQGELNTLQAQFQNCGI